MNIDSSIRCITLKSETSPRAVVLSGLDYAKGEFIIVMKGDLQHPSAMIPKMVNMLKKGSDIINMHPDNTMKASVWKRKVFDFFYKLSPEMNTHSVKDISDFRGFRREVTEDILFIQKNHFFMEEFFNWNEYTNADLSYYNRRHAKYLYKYSISNLLYNLKIFRDQATPGQMKIFDFIGKIAFTTSLISLISYVLLDQIILNIHPIYYTAAIIIGLIGIQIVILSNYKRKLKEDLYYCSRSNQYLVENIYDNSELIEVADLRNEENNFRIRKVS